MFWVGTALFVDKSTRYVDVTYLRYFMDLTTVHQWNWGSAILVYLYQKLNEAFNWRTRQLTGSCTLLTAGADPCVIERGMLPPQDENHFNIAIKNYFPPILSICYPT